jgi:hypothetical protein
MAPVTEKRLAMLDAFEAAVEAAGKPLTVDQVLDAFMLPVVEMSGSLAREFGPLMGRLYTEPSEFIERLYKDHLEVVAKRFVAAFRRALPNVPEVELLWRLHFVIGIMGHTLGAGRLLKFLSEGRCDPSDLEGTYKVMKAFVIAGLQAPVSTKEVHHASQ